MPFFGQATILLVLLSFFCRPCFAEGQIKTVQVRSRDELINAVQRAQPGTQILIAPGEYRGGMTFNELRGTKEQPIVLAALDPQNPPEIVGGTTAIHLTSPRFVELRHLILRGATDNGLNIDDGGKPLDPALNIVLSQLQVREIGPQGNHDGIKLSGVENFVIEGCKVERWGEAGSAIDMVGCHHGEIKDCQLRFRSDIPGNGVQTKGGTAHIAVRRCQFIDSGSRSVQIGGSTGRDFFRPRDADYEARDILVEDCTFSGSMSPIAFVGVDGAVVRYNTIYRPTRWVIRILQETRGAEFISCRNGEFSNNLVVFDSEEVRTVVNVGDATSPETFRFAQNHWYRLDAPQNSHRLNLPTPETEGRYGKDPLFRDAEAGDFQLRKGTPVKDAGVRPEGIRE
ncbi:right-handed parallel beta-helix repeat-containing protein [Lacunimicrobium album]